MLSEKIIPVQHNILKRLFDIGFAACAVLLLAPLFLLIALAIKLTSPGPVVYSQERIGRGGKVFRCHKFRSMYRDADQRLKEILANDPERYREYQTFWKLKNDPRVTPLGKFLRKTSLDELPQFFNVIKGDLSVVGPRPYTLPELKKFRAKQVREVLSVRPGLTCFWSISGRSQIDLSRRIIMDQKYVQKRNFFVDIALIAKTIPIMINSKGAY